MVIRSNYSVSNVVTEIIIKVIFEVMNKIAALKSLSDNKILRARYNGNDFKR